VHLDRLWGPVGEDVMERMETLRPFYPFQSQIRFERPT
jgi:hypothetical protein